MLRRTVCPQSMLLQPVTDCRRMLAALLSNCFQRHPLRQAIRQELPLHAHIMSSAADRTLQRELPLDPLGAGYALDQGGAFAAEGGATLVVVGLACGGDLALEAALLEQQVVELHRLGRGGLVV